MDILQQIEKELELRHSMNAGSGRTFDLLDGARQQIGELQAENDKLREENEYLQSAQANGNAVYEKAMKDCIKIAEEKNRQSKVVEAARELADTFRSVDKYHYAAEVYKEIKRILPKLEQSLTDLEEGDR